MRLRGLIDLRLNAVADKGVVRAAEYQCVSLLREQWCHIALHQQRCVTCLGLAFFDLVGQSIAGLQQEARTAGLGNLLL